MAMHEPEIAEVVRSAGGLLDYVVDVGLTVVALHEQPAQLAQTPVPGNHSQAGASPRGGAVAAGGRRWPAVRLRAARAECRDSARHFQTTRT